MFEEGINFPFLPFLIERQFIYFFEIERLWLVIIFYKLMSFFVISIGFKKLFNIKDNSFVLFSLCLAIFCCIDLPPFNDRYPRPLFSNIFLFSIFVLNLQMHSNQKLSNIIYFIYGVFHTVLAMTDPWSLAIISPMSLLSIIKTKTAFRYIALGFLVFMIPILIYFSFNLVDSSHSEYLGMKTIHEPFLLSLIHI